MTDDTNYRLERIEHHLRWQWLAIAIMAVLLSFFAVQAVGQDLAAGPIELLHTESDAVAWAFTAMLSYDSLDQPYIRCVYLPPWADPEWIYAVDVAVNLSVGHGRQLVRGDQHAGGWLLAYNFRRLVPNLSQRIAVLAIWDSLAIFDSRFHISNLNTGFKNTAVLAPHLGTALAKHVSDKTKDTRIDLLVTQLTSSTGGIYPADFIIEQCLWDRYGELRLHPKGKTKDGHTEIQQLLKRNGFYFEVTKKSGADKGALLTRSGVLRQGWRSALAIYGTNSRSPALGTFDFKRDNQDPTKAPIRNLVDPVSTADAQEWFIPIKNGLSEMALVDKFGVLIDFAPADVAIDYQQPKGGELNNCMSCITCHMPVQGYVQPVKSVTALLLFSEADYVGEELIFDGTTLSADEALDIVVGRYDGTFERIILPRANQDFVSSIGYLAPYPVGERNAAQLVGDKIKAIWYSYRHGAYDADRLCLELGVRVPAGAGRQVLATLVQVPEGTIVDPLVPLVINGAEINRHDVDAIYPDMAQWAATNREKLK